MISYLSDKIASFFIVHGIIKYEDKEVYSYSFEILIATLLNFLALGVISIITSTVVETAFYLLAFIPLRQLAGGYHAKNHLRCFIALMCIYVIFLFIINFLPIEYILITVLLCLMVSSVLVFIFSPVDDPNKPLSPKEVAFFKRKSRIAMIVYIAVTILVFFLKEIWALCLALGIISVALTLLASAIKQKIFSEK